MKPVAERVVPEGRGPEGLRVAFLGPAGTNTHAAAISLFGEGFVPLATSNIRGVFEAVERGEADRGVVPVENSTGGAVTQTLDSLLELSPVVIAEHVDEISHHLAALRGCSIADIATVGSHPQALAQCERWLRAHLPHAEQVAQASTSHAAHFAAATPHTAAICTPLAAELAGLEILASHIEDVEHNATRFFAIGRDLASPTGSDKTSLVFTARHERGALRRVLEVFDRHELNLTRIESRPLREHRWEYAFYADLEGAATEGGPVASALLELAPICGMVKVLGSYPRAPSVG